MTLVALPVASKHDLLPMITCPISKQPMCDAVLASDGYVYSHDALITFWKACDEEVRSPITGLGMTYDVVRHKPIQSLAHETVDFGSPTIDVSAEPPESLMCPITCDLMIFPVLASDGFLYEKAAISEWARGVDTESARSPMTNERLTAVFREDKTTAIFCAAWK